METSSGRPSFCRSEATGQSHTVVIALDKDGRDRTSVEWMPSNLPSHHTNWLLVRTIPITTSLTTVLRRLLECEQTQQVQLSMQGPEGTSASVVGKEREVSPGPPHPLPLAPSLSSPATSLSRSSATHTRFHTPGCHQCFDAASCIQAVRVGYVIGEVHCFCLLVQCCCWGACERLKLTLLATPGPCADFAVEYVQPSRSAAGQHPSGHHTPPAPLGSVPSTPVMMPLDAIVPGTELPSVSATVPWSLSPSTGSPSPQPSVSLGPSMACAGSGALLHSEGTRHSVSALYGVAAADEMCPICLVELLRTHAPLVTLCKHVFHLQCYAPMSSTSGCPICRLSVYDLLSNAHCETCGTTFDLWTCLICGHVGCGQTGRGNHQLGHFHVTGHSCAVQCSSNRLFNHSTGMFIHQEVATLLLQDEERERDSGPAHLSRQPPALRSSFGPGRDSGTATPQGCGDHRFDWLASLSWGATAEEEALERQQQGEAETQSLRAIEALVKAHYTQLLHTLRMAQREDFRSTAATQRIQERLRQEAVSSLSPSGAGRPFKRVLAGGGTRTPGSRAPNGRHATNPNTEDVLDGGEATRLVCWYRVWVVRLEQLLCEEQQRRNALRREAERGWRGVEEGVLASLRAQLRRAKESARTCRESLELSQQRVRNSQFQLSRSAAQRDDILRSAESKRKEKEAERDRLQQEITTSLDMV